MKTAKTLALFAAALIFLSCATSCVVVPRKDNGKHKGWFKNTNNPHHPASTNPGKAKANGKHRK